MVVEAAAKHSATTVGKDETVGELLAVVYRRPANLDPYFFSTGSMALLGETRGGGAGCRRQSDGGGSKET